MNDLQWNLTIKSKGMAKYVHYNKFLLYRGSFLYLNAITGVKNIFRYTGDFVI